MNILNVNMGMILIKPIIDEKSSGGIFLAPTATGEQLVTGDVIQIGIPQTVDGASTSMMIMPGQKVLFNKSDSWKIKSGGEDMYITYQSRVLATVV
jgi:co-chaperonin GroES (HSP10)